MKRHVPWQKNLYDNHGLPDNYTDTSFLEHLRKNIKPNNVTLLEAINLGASISIQLNIVVLVTIIFIWLHNDWITPNVILRGGFVLSIQGYFIYELTIHNMAHLILQIAKVVRTVILFFVFGYILSPVLRTLTETVSTDTIYAMTILMFLIHLIFTNYGSLPISHSNSLSITSSTFGSLMLASRLATPLHAFSLLTASVQCFVLLPIFLNRLRKSVISIPLTIGIIYLLLYVSYALTYIFILATVFIQFICPVWYIHCQKYKDNIYGPWDEAVIVS